MGKKNNISRARILDHLLKRQEANNNYTEELSSNLINELQKFNNGESSVQDFYREIRKSPKLKRELENFNHTVRKKMRNGN